MDKYTKISIKSQVSSWLLRMTALITKGENFFDFLFAFLATNPVQNEVCSVNERIFSTRMKFFPFRADSIEKEEKRKENRRIASPDSVPVYLKSILNIS